MQWFRIIYSCRTSVELYERVQGTVSHLGERTRHDDGQILSQRPVRCMP